MHANLRAARFLTATLLALGVAAAGAGTGESPRPDESQAGPPAAEKKAAATASPRKQQPLRFTNDDLPRLRREHRGEDPPPGETAEGEGEPGEVAAGPGDGEARSAVAALEDEAHARRLADTRRRIAELESRQQHLEARLRSIQNPLLRGVTSAGEEEQEAVGGLSNEEQLTWVKEELATTEQALEEARAALTELLRR